MKIPRILTLRTLVFVLVPVLLTACYTPWRVVNGNGDAMNLNRPTLVPGQVAYIDAGPFVIEGFRRTGLFKSVQRAPSSSPSPTGYFIQVREVLRMQKSSPTGLFGALISVFTLGLVPDPACHETEVDYVVDVLYNGAPAFETHVSSRQQTICGWYALFVDKDDINRDEAALVINQTISSMNAINKRNKVGS